MSQPSRSAPAENDIAKTSSLLRNPKLRHQRFGGYSIEDTDALLQRAADAVDRLRKTMTTLQAQPAEAAPLPATELLPAKDTATQAGEVLIAAHEAVELLKAKAQHEADRIVEEAHGRAATVLADAVKERARLEQERDAAAGIVEQARAEAAHIVDDARRERDGIAAGSERLRSAAEELRRSWIAQVSHVIDQLADTPPPAAPTHDADAAEIERELLARLQDSPAAASADAGTAPRQ